MRIGIDIRPLQGHHSVRGIGMHIKMLTQWIMKNHRNKDDTIVFYVYKDLPNPIDEITSSVVAYETVYLSDYRNSYPILPTIVTAGIAFIRRVLTPIPDSLSRKCDVFLAFDFMLGMPRKDSVKYVLIGYDLIQIMYSHQYLPSFNKAKHRKGIRQALFGALVSFLYRRALDITRRNNVRYLSISDASKQQFMQYANIPEHFIKTVYLGNPISRSHFLTNQDDLIRVNKYERNSYLLFIGGTDWRRKLKDLVTAYNRLRARGHDIKLILAGFDFQSIETVTSDETRHALEMSSYRDGIEFLGFINDSEKQYLYENALCFVFPSICEGFGLPILEAMQEGCPVIAYDGPLSSMKEVAGDSALIINPNASALYESIVSLIEKPSLSKKLIAGGYKNIDRFSWDKCAEQTIHHLKDDSFIG